jgi:hypothetical protein
VMAGDQMQAAERGVRAWAWGPLPKGH